MDSRLRAVLSGEMVQEKNNRSQPTSYRGLSAVSSDRNSNLDFFWIPRTSRGTTWVRGNCKKLAWIYRTAVRAGGNLFSLKHPSLLKSITSAFSKIDSRLRGNDSIYVTTKAKTTCVD